MASGFFIQDWMMIMMMMGCWSADNENYRFETVGVSLWSTLYGFDSITVLGSSARKSHDRNKGHSCDLCGQKKVTGPREKRDRKERVEQNSFMQIKS